MLAATTSVIFRVVQEGNCRVLRGVGVSYERGTPVLDQVWSVATSPDGSLSASGGKDGAVVLWTPTKAVVGTARGHSGEVDLPPSTF